MNPAKLLHSTPQRTNRLAQINPPAAPAPSPKPAAAIDGFSSNIVGSIPVRTPAGGPAAHGNLNEDGELDQLMQDVSQELKQGDKKPAKKHWFSRRQPKPPKVKANNPPRPPVRTVQAPAPAPGAAKPKAAQPKPVKQPRRDLPLTVILLTILVTGALIAIAVYAYK